MEKIDYSKLNKITLEDSEMFSSLSIEVRKVLENLEISKVGEFLELIDNNQFKGYRFEETLMEARGLATLLKYKYLNISIEYEISFFTPIKYMYFEPVSVWLYGIKKKDNSKINLYSLITYLGFNANEREKILDVDEDSLDDTLLIDLLYNAYVRLTKNMLVEEMDKVLVNKLLCIIKYYLVHYKDDTVSNFMKEFYIGIEEFNDLLIMKNNKSGSRK